MNKETFNELADKLAMNLKSEEDVSEMAWMLSKVAMERALEIEMEEHLGEKTNGRTRMGIPETATHRKLLKPIQPKYHLRFPETETPILNHRW